MHNWMNDHFLDTWIGQQVPIFNNIFLWGCTKENVYVIEVQDHDSLVNHILLAVTDSMDLLNVAVKHA
jgi:hypothetical protein